MLVDTSRDGIATFLGGYVIVQERPRAAENVAEANLAARELSKREQVLAVVHGRDDARIVAQALNSGPE